jgi:hypothetical protein
MRELNLSDRSSSPLLQEEELLEKLRACGACKPDRVRLTMAGRWLFVDGFVDSLEQKLQAERACRQLAHGCTVVNRLRVAAAEETPVS